MYKSVLSIGITILYGYQPSSVLFLLQNSEFCTRITNLYASQTSPVILCMKNSVISIRITSLYGSQPLSLVLHANQRLLEKNYKSIWVPALICGLCMQNSALWTSIQVPMCTRPHLSFCAYKPAWLAPEILVSMGSSPHMRFCAFKTAIFGWE